MIKKLWIVACLLIPGWSIAQIVGMWEVIEVNVGEDVMTPQSKWFQFKGDGTLYGGNGGVINTRGTYEIEDLQISVLNEKGQDDGYGPFTFEHSSDSTMLWSRLEDGALVKIKLKVADMIPMAPWDKLVGHWKIGGKEETYFFRWDKFFVHRSEGKETWGIWHMHAHKPELRLMYFEEGKEDDLWTYIFADDGIKLVKGGGIMMALVKDD